MNLLVRGIPSDEVERIRCGGADAHGQPALVRIAEGLANPCRHCLGLIGEDQEKLVLAYRPFNHPQPYAETGPIFLHKSPCERYESNALPPWFDYLDPAMVRGYDREDWIRYGTGSVVRGAELTEVCARILGDESVAYAHIRSKFGCFQCRVERG